MMRQICVVIVACLMTWSFVVAATSHNERMMGVNVTVTDDLTHDDLLIVDHEYYHDHEHLEGDSHESHDGMSFSEDLAAEKHKPWAIVILSCLLVNAASLTGVILIVPCLLRARFRICMKTSANLDPNPNIEPRSLEKSKLLDIAVPSFSCGALMAAAVFLIIPESIHLIADGVSMTNGSHDGDEHGHRRLQDDRDSEVSWKFGLSILIGFLLPLVLSAMFPRAAEHECDSECGEAKDNAVANCLVVEEPCDKCEDIAEGTSLPSTAAFTAVTSNHGHDFHDHHHPHHDKYDHDHDHHQDKHDMHLHDSSPPPQDSKASPSHSCEDIDCSPDHKSPNSVILDGTADLEAQKTCNSAVCTHARRTRRDINLRLCASILIGDGFHNYADGIFIGTAFLLCSKDLAISIMLISLYHEIAQEVADYLLLTKHAGLPVCLALIFNFLSGLSVVFGGITILAIDLNSTVVGFVLGVAAGGYIYIGASECIPRVDQFVRTGKDRLLAIFMFVFGAVPIGLVLINHHHCSG